MVLVIENHADRIFLPGAATYTEMISGLWKKIHVTNVLVVDGRQPSDQVEWLVHLQSNLYTIYLSYTYSWKQQPLFY